MSVLKAAIVGAGNIAKTSHIPSYQSLEIDVAAISDISLAKAEECAKEFSIPFAFDSIDQMLESVKPDIVSICVPNKFHKDAVLKALSCGAHVICEKPPAMNAEDALLMQKASEKNNRILTYGFQHRFTPEYLMMEKRVKNGDFGRIYHTEVSWLRRRGIPGWGVFTDKSIQGGGALMDIGCHMLDAAFSLLGFPEISYVVGSEYDLIGKKGGEGDFGMWSAEKFTVEDSLFGFIVFKDGSSLSLKTSFALNMKEKNDKNIHFYGEKLGASLYPLEYYNGKEARAAEVEESNPRLSMMRDFITSVKEGKKPRIKAEEGTYLMKVVDALYRSAETKQPVLF